MSRFFMWARSNIAFTLMHYSSVSIKSVVVKLLMHPTFCDVNEKCGPHFLWGVNTAVTGPAKIATMLER